MPVTAASRLGAAASLAVVLFGLLRICNGSESWFLLKLANCSTLVVELYESLAITVEKLWISSLTALSVELHVPVNRSNTSLGTEVGLIGTLYRFKGVEAACAF